MNFLSLLVVAMGIFSNAAADDVEGYAPPLGSIVIVTDGPHFSRDQLRGYVEWVLISPEQVAMALEACDMWYVLEFPHHFPSDEVIDAVVAHFSR